MAKKYALGDIRTRGIVPCADCRESHDERVIHVEPLQVSWLKNGHAYRRVSPRKFIEGCKSIKEVLQMADKIAWRG